MRTQLITLIVASLALYSVGRPWMKAMASGVAAAAGIALAYVLLADLLP